MSPVSAISVANEFIRLAAAKGTSCSNMKLQKLVYFAHGLHLAFDKGPLVKEQFEAWKYGPVIPDLYHKFKGYFAGPIPVNHPFKDTGEPLSDFANALIARTFEVFGPMSATRLSAISHSNGSPWYTAYHNTGESAAIDDSAVAGYFKRHYIAKSAK